MAQLLMKRLEEQRDKAKRRVSKGGKGLMVAKTDGLKDLFLSRPGHFHEKLRHILHSSETDNCLPNTTRHDLF